MSKTDTVLTDERIFELREAAIPRLNLAHVTADGLPESPNVDAAMAYLKDNAAKFADPVDDKCLNCRRILVGFLLGSFTWGIIHGEGMCSYCGWPARAYHYYEVNGERQRFEAVLQYHPEQLITDEENQ